MTKLADMGIQVDRKRILAPPVAAADYLLQQGRTRAVLLVAAPTHADFVQLDTRSHDNGSQVDAVGLSR